MATIRRKIPFHPPVPATLAMLPSLIALLALAPASSSAATACDDDFSGPALAAAWSFVDADGEPGGSARLNGGKLELAGKGSDAFNAVNEFVGVKRPAEAGDFDVSVKIESQTATHGWAQAGILAANDAGDPSKGGYVIVDVTPANGYHAFYDAAGSVGTLDKHADAGVTAYPVWLRLARTGTKFSAWYRNQPQGSWTAIAQAFETQGTGSASQLALVSLSHNDTAEGKAVFDDFTCQGKAAGLPAAWRAGGPGEGFPAALRERRSVLAERAHDALGKAARVGANGGHSAYTVFTFTNSRMPNPESSRP